MTDRLRTISVRTQSLRQTQPGHPFLGSRNVSAKTGT